MNELIELCMTAGVSGREEKVREKIKELLKEKDRTSTDKIGNLTLEKGEGKKKIILLAHMDEIGFYITHIRNDGKLVVRNVGGIIEESLPSTAVDIITSEGKVEGVFGAVSPHLKNDGESFEKVIDVGANNQQEVEALGIQVMDFAVFKKIPIVLNKRYLSVRSLDDRFGCYTLVRCANESNPKEKVIFAWTVQEEVGLVGAKAIVKNYSDVHLAIAIDSFACCSKQNKHIELGRGPVLRVLDNSSISDPKYINKFAELSERYGIPIQIGATGGGNDASVFLQVGIPMIALSVPVRYLHSTVEMIHLDDLENLIKLLKIFLEESEI